MIKPYYSNRQQKIYTDYQEYSSQDIKAMMTSDDYIAEVVDVMEDILIERNVLNPEYKLDKIKEQKKIAVEEINETSIEDRFAARKNRQKEVAEFIQKYQLQTDAELSEIISKYTEYQLASVEAALEVSCERGTITTDEKDLMLNEMEDRLLKKKEVKKSEVSQEKYFGKIEMIIGLGMLAGAGLAFYLNTIYGFLSLFIMGAYLVITGFFKMI